MLIQHAQAAIYQMFKKCQIPCHKLSSDIFGTAIFGEWMFFDSGNIISDETFCTQESNYGGKGPVIIITISAIWWGFGILKYGGDSENIFSSCSW